MIPSRTAVGEQPQYSKLEPLTFQDLCKEILQAGPNFRNVQIFGRPGQKQRGIDILAERLSPSGLTVGQCKRVQVVDEPLIRGAIKEFLKHRDHWKRQGVDTFILFVSCDASDTRVQSEFLRQSRRLQKSGIAFELWSDTTITHHLRPYPGVVSTYLAGEWPTILCGGNVSVPVVGLPYVSNLLVTQLEQVASQFSDLVERNLESAREAWRAGNKDDAAQTVERYREPSTWQTLKASTRSFVCRLEGQLALDDGQVERAKTLLIEADSYAPGKSPRLHALVLRAENRRAEARAVLRESVEIENVTLDAALCLEMGEVHVALQRLESIGNSSDAHRLRALAHLLEGSVELAHAEIVKAILIAPSWTINRFTQAIIDYYRCMSPSRRLKELPPWPEPPDWSQVRTDDESRSRLSKAAAVFRELKNLSSTDFRSKRILQTWELACVANDPKRRSEANELCSGILADDPANEYCLVWAVGRRLDVDMTESRALLEQKARKLDEAPDSVIALLICYLEEQDIASAKQLLVGTEEKFARIQQIPVWRFWRDQIAAIGGEADIENRGGVERDSSFEKLVLRCRARRSDDWEPLIELLMGSDAEGDGSATFELCALLASKKRWQQAVPLAEKLLTIVQTTEALRLACTVLFNADLFMRCAEIIESHRSWFPNSQLPISFLQMKATAERHSGEVRSAIRTAEDAFVLEATRVNFLALAEFYLESGNFTSLAQHASRHERFPDLTSGDLLRLSARLSGVNQLVGVGLWERANAQGIPDEQVIGAVSVGYSLGLDSRLASLIVRLATLPESMGLQRLDFAQVRQVFESQNAAANATYEQYRNGDICLHAATSSLGSQLSSWYHRRLVDNASERTRQSPLYARHGWRSRSEANLSTPSRLCADLSALMLAQELGVLPQIVSALRPLFVSRHALLALAAMREATLPNQPSRKANLIAVHNAIGQKLIFTLQAEYAQPSEDSLLFHLACQNDALFVDFSPTPSTSEGEAPSNENLSRFRSPHAVIRAATYHGRLSSDRSDIALQNVGQERESGAGGNIGLKQRLFTNLAVVESFARGGVLKEICEAFAVVVREEDVNTLSQMLNSFQKAEEDSEWLGSLIEKLRSGLDTGDFHLLPLLDTPEESCDLDDHEPIELRCLSDLLRYKNETTDLIWIDDRALNGFIHRDGSRIVDTVDLLLHLRSTGRLADSEFYGFLHRYRVSGVRFLALRKDELLYWLEAALTPDGQFGESFELNTIRVSHAKAVSDAMFLRTTPISEGQILEWPFLLDSSAVVLDAIHALWSSRGSSAGIEKKADWLMTHLYLADRGRSSALPHVTAESDLLIEAMTLGGMIAATCVGFDNDDRGRSARRDYLNWLYHRVLAPRFESDPDLKEATFSQTRLILESLRSPDRDDAPAAAALAVIMKSWIDDLPEEIRNRIAADNGLLESFGVKMHVAVSVGNTQFDARKFWVAAQDVLRTGKPVSIGAFQLFSLSRDGLSLLATEDVRTGEKSLLEEAPLEILSSRASQRELALEKITKAFDLPQRDTDNLKRLLSDERSPAKVMERIAILKEQSAPQFYRRLKGKLERREQISRSDLIPSDMQLFLRHLRLNVEGVTVGEGDKPRDLLAILATELPVEEAVIRLAELPRRLPAEALIRLRELPLSERRQLFKKLLKCGRGSVVAASHLCNLLYIFEADNRAYVRLADKSIEMLSHADNTTPVHALLRILGHIEAELWLTADFPKFPSAYRLLFIWTHAVNLLLTMADVGVDLNWIQENFGKGWNRLPSEVLCEDAEYRTDVAHPSRLESSRFVLALTGYASQNGERLAQKVRKKLSESWTSDAAKVIALLFDSSREPNSTGSVFAEDQGWPNILADEALNVYSVARNPTAAGETAIQLLNGGDPILWAHLHAVMKDGIISPEAQVSIQELVISTDFEKLSKEKPEVASIALIFASIHARRLGSGVIEKVRRDILKIAAAVVKDDEASIRERIDGRLLSAAFYLYKPFIGSGTGYEEIAKLWTELIEVFPSATSDCLVMVNRLVEGLPNRHSRYLWKLQVHLRSLDPSSQE
jgi:hypothetical protein